MTDKLVFVASGKSSAKPRMLEKGHLSPEDAAGIKRYLSTSTGDIVRMSACTL